MSRRLHVLLLGLGALAVGWAALTLTFFRSGGRLNVDPPLVVAFVALGSLWILAGLIAWWKRPDNHTGALMAAAGFLVFTWLPSFWEASLPSTVFGITDRLFLAVAVHLFVAFPRGRLSSPIERVVVAAVYAVVLLVAGLGVQLFRGPHDPLSVGGPRNLLLVDDNRGLADAVELSADVVLAGLFVAAAVLLARRWRTASAPARRALAPVLWSGALVLFLGAALLTHYPSYDTAVGSVLLSVFLVAVGIVPLAFLAGLLRTRLHRSAVADLVVELGSPLRPSQVRDAIARTLGDPSLELAFWLPEGERYVDPDGTASTRRRILDERSPCSSTTGHAWRRSSTTRRCSTIQSSSRRSAPPPASRSRTRVCRQSCARSSRKCAPRGPGSSRQETQSGVRLERDLHDGAQQRLLGIRLALQLARGQLAGGLAEVDDLLAEADAEVVGALDDLRALARGIHPAILTDEGLAPALSALARRAAVPVELTVCAGRLPATVEATAYFVSAESLANIAKHAHASHVRLEVARTNGRVAIVVSDDGVGGADAAGAGLRGLRDRVEALDGRLEVESPPGGGTRVSAAIPCA